MSHKLWNYALHDYCKIGGVFIDIGGKKRTLAIEEFQFLHSNLKYILE